VEERKPPLHTDDSTSTLPLLPIRLIHFLVDMLSQVCNHWHNGPWQSSSMANPWVGAVFRRVRMHAYLGPSSGISP
jgi:hypothetical protein